MGQISLEGMRFYAYHGFYDEEQVMGNDYVVDIHIKANLKSAGRSDDLTTTINYETVYLICKNEMAKPRKLLETIAHSILGKMKHQFATLQEVTVNIKKINPPLGGRVARASVEISESFSKKCGRCGSGLICYSDGNCWCQDLRVHPETMESLQAQYNGCLCKNCLTFFADQK